VTGSVGGNLLRCARESSVTIRSACGGLGLCGKCVVRVLRGAELLSPPTEAEREWLGERLESGFRLACQAFLLRAGDLEVEIPPVSRGTGELSLLPALGIRVKVEPPVQRVLVSREGKTFTRVLRGGSPLAEEEGVGEVLGIALDLGTTNLVGYLLDLETGEILSAAAVPNPQPGEDVMTRLTLSLQGEDLRAPLLSGIGALIRRLCGGRERWVYEVTAVGNSVMHHFFFNLPLDSLARPPFSPHTLLPLERPAAGLGLDLPGWVYSPPLVGGFVGSDCVADLLASRLWQRSEPWLLVDIGTNTEVVLSDGKRMFACSCASGPAFEGGRLTCGMRAGEGAIWGVRLDDSLNPSLQVAGTPLGLCGSGAVDLLAELVKRKAVSADGRMVGEGGRFREGRHGREFVVHGEVVFTQSDVRELQLAKAAVAAGIEVLMDLAGVELGGLSCLAVAGAFGASLNTESATSIGMLPPTARVIKLGHGAGLGAQLMLLSARERETARELARKIEHVSLAGREDFKKRFVEAMRLGPLA